MNFGNMPQYTVNHGIHTRADGEKFSIESTLYEMQPERLAWKVIFVTKHNIWRDTVLVAIIPKQIATSVALAGVMRDGSILDQVKSELNKVNAGDRDFIACPSHNGWYLFG